MEATIFRSSAQGSIVGCTTWRHTSRTTQLDARSSVHSCAAVLGHSGGSSSSNSRKPRDKPTLSFGVGGKKWLSSLAGAAVAGSESNFDVVQQSGGDGASAADFLGDGPVQDDDDRELASTDEQKRVMCLMSDTGGGHRASAVALKDAFEALYGNKYDVNVVDLWSTNSPWPFCNMPKSYFFLVKHPWLWRMSFRMSEPELFHEAMFTGYTAVVGRRFAQAFQEYKPHLIISVHPLMQHVPLKVDKCFVATQIVAAQAMKVGLTAAQVSCYGLPIRPAFNLPQRPKAEMRAALGMDTEARTVMLVGGGEGMGTLEATALALTKTLSPDDQIVVICGRNKKLAEKLSRQKWPVKMVVKGFVTNMAEFMSACDAIITKAGPGTIAEALICGMPILLNGYIPCQEEGNVSFVLENGVGAYNEDPKEMARIIAEWFNGDGDVLEEMSRKAKRLGRPEAVFNIVRELADMAS